MNDPKRWLDDPEQSAQLRVDLQRAADAVPKYDASAGLAALQSAIQAGAPAAASVAPASLGKLGLAAGISAALAAGVVAVVLLRAPAKQAPPAPRAAPHTVQAPAVQAPPPSPRVAPVAPRDEPVIEAPAVEAQAVNQAPAVRGTATEREIAQLARIKAVLDADPRLALQLAQHGHREFARGVLRPEREGLAIVALYALERRAEADERARAYLAAHPKGVMAERVRALRGSAP
jgi:hypothetical protein